MDLNRRIVNEISELFGYNFDGLVLLADDMMPGCLGSYNHGTNTINIRQNLEPKQFISTLFHENWHRIQFENEDMAINEIELRTYMYGETYLEKEIEVKFKSDILSHDKLMELGYRNFPWEIEAREVAEEMTKQYLDITEIEELK